MSILTNELIFLNVECTSSDDVIKLLGNEMKKCGLVKDTYIDAVIAREIKYPTGLPTDGIKVAIPHTDNIHVLKSAIGIATLKKPVEFGIMGGDGEKLEAEIVFLLAIQDPKLQLEFLRKMTSLLCNGELLLGIKNSTTNEEIISLLSMLQN